MNKIPLFKVNMAPGVGAAIEDVVASGTITEGPQVKRFEHALSEYMGVPVLTMNSCTSALQMAAELLGVDSGDEVISTPITCAATNLALVAAGARIVWADVNPATGLIDPEDVARKITSKTVAVAVVDWGGAVVSADAIREAADRNDMHVIEDAAHAFGTLRTMPTADFVCWSFQAIKHLTTGDGGGLYVMNESLREEARRRRWFGIDRQSPGPNIDKPIFERGFKWHMNDLNATIGIHNFNAALNGVAKHRANALWYSQNLRDCPGIRVPPPDPTSSWWLYTIILERDNVQQEFIAWMADRGIECSKVHARNDLHPVFGDFVGGSLPGVTYFDRHQVAIPVGWWLGEPELDRVANAVRSFAITNQ